MHDAVVNFMNTDPAPLRRLPDGYMGTSAYSSTPTFPHHRFPEYWAKPGFNCHGGMIGPTGSGKSDRMVAMLTCDNPIPYDTLYYVTSFTDSPPMRKLASSLQKRKIDESRGKNAELYQDQDSPNFKFHICNGPAFQAHFRLDDIKLEVQSKSGEKVKNHTVVVIDDAQIDRSLVARLLQEGRNKGITAVVTLQDMSKKEIIDDALKRQMQWFVFFKAQRAAHNLDYYTRSLLGMTPNDARELSSQILGLEEGQCIIANNTHQGSPYFCDKLGPPGLPASTSSLLKHARTSYERGEKTADASCTAPKLAEPETHSLIQLQETTVSTNPPKGAKQASSPLMRIHAKLQKTEPILLF